MSGLFYPVEFRDLNLVEVSSKVSRVKKDAQLIGSVINNLKIDIEIMFSVRAFHPETIESVVFNVITKCSAETEQSFESEPMNLEGVFYIFESLNALQMAQPHNIHIALASSLQSPPVWKG